MTDDASSRPGWYWVRSLLTGREFALNRNEDGLWVLPDQCVPALSTNFRPLCRIDDLLRDAARYRWLRAEHRISEIFVGDRGDALNLDNGSPEDIDGLIDAEIARERENDNG